MIREEIMSAESPLHIWCRQSIERPKLRYWDGLAWVEDPQAALVFSTLEAAEIVAARYDHTVPHGDPTRFARVVVDGGEQWT